MQKHLYSNVYPCLNCAGEYSVLFNTMSANLTFILDKSATKGVSKHQSNHVLGIFCPVKKCNPHKINEGRGPNLFGNPGLISKI